MSNVELAFRKKAKDQADEIISLVKESPDYFLMQGGSDGTFGHVRWHWDYGHLLPEITALAVELGGRV